MGDKPKALPGEVPHREEPKLQEHVWSKGGVSGTDSFGAPSWLNSENGNVVKSCLRCGCDLLTEGSVIRADETPVGTQLWTYRDRKGHQIRSYMELSCPIPVTREESTAVALEQSRRAKVTSLKAEIRAEEAEYRITQLEYENRALTGSLLDRITQLEAKNKELEAQIGSVTQLDLGPLAQKLFELAQEAKEKKALESVESKGRTIQIPKELVEVIDVVGIPVNDPQEEDDGGK